MLILVSFLRSRTKMFLCYVLHYTFLSKAFTVQYLSYRRSRSWSLTWSLSTVQLQILLCSMRCQILSITYLKDPLQLLDIG
jgi:hypothetical protein